MNKRVLAENFKIAFKNFEIAIRKHSDINKKRADGGWSVAEIADHIVKGTQINFGATKKTERAYDKNADSIKSTFLNFALRFPSVPQLHPTSKQYSLDEVMESLEDNKKGILKMIEHDDLEVTCTDISLPIWGNLTKFEWLVLIENHIIRHTRQVNDFDTIAI